jgi:hypothetical protein
MTDGCRGCWRTVWGLLLAAKATDAEPKMIAAASTAEILLVIFILLH